METPFMLFCVLIVCLLLLFIAEPHRFLPERRNKKKMVGSTYWGVYEGAPMEEPESQRTVELQEVARKQQYVAGSSTYSLGRGVKMSGRG